jgi:hypothetical protein
MNYPLKLKKHLAKKMAKVDQEAMGLNYEECYEFFLAMESFELLSYWIEYFGVFDNPEDNLLNELNPKNV